MCAMNDYIFLAYAQWLIFFMVLLLNLIVRITSFIAFTMQQAVA